MSTPIPTFCAGCGLPVGGTTFYEDGEPYHHGWRPSQQVVVGTLNAEANQWTVDWGDAQNRIAELEAENTRLFQRLNEYAEEFSEDRFTYRKRAEQAEADLAALKQITDEMEEFIDSCTYHMRRGETVSYEGRRGERGTG